MELQELKNIWHQHDEKLDKQVQINMYLLKKIELDKTRSAVRKLMVGPILGIISGALAQILLGLFIFEHFSSLAYAGPALLLDLCAVLLVISNAVQLSIIDKIDYGAPVVTIQQNLEKLRMHRVRYTTMLKLSGPLLWLPVVIVTVKGCYGFDLFYHFDPTWIASQYAFGLVILALGIWLAKRYNHGQISRPWLKKLMDDMAGRNLAVAIASLKEIEDFARETR